MFVFLWFYVSLENFSLIWRRHLDRWRAANFHLYSAYMAIEQWVYVRYIWKQTDYKNLVPIISSLNYTSRQFTIFVTYQDNYFLALEKIWKSMSIRYSTDNVSLHGMLKVQWHFESVVLETYNGHNMRLVLKRRPEACFLCQKITKSECKRTFMSNMYPR